MWLSRNVFNLFTPFSGNLVRLHREMERMEFHPQLEVYATRVHWRVVLLSFGKLSCLDLGRVVNL